MSLMGEILLLPVLLALLGLASYLISRGIYKRLRKANYGHAMGWSIFIFVLVFVVLTIIAWLSFLLLISGVEC